MVQMGRMKASEWVDGLKSAVKVFHIVSCVVFGSRHAPCAAAG